MSEAKTSPTTTRAVSGWPVGQTYAALRKKDPMDIHRLSNTEQMEWLCEQFPSLHGAPGTKPWRAMTFQGHFHGPAGTGGSRHAARFVLNVWNNAEEWAIGPFNVTHAMGVWDNAHRCAFLAWATDPWFP